MTDSDAIEKATRYSTDKYDSRRRDLCRMADEKLAQTRQRLGQAGALFSSSMDRAVGENRATLIRELVQARVDSLIDGYEINAVSITTPLEHSVVAQAEEIHSLEMAHAISIATSLGTPRMGVLAINTIKAVEFPEKAIRCQIEERRASPKIVPRPLSVTNLQTEVGAGSLPTRAPIEAPAEPNGILGKSHLHRDLEEQLNVNAVTTVLFLDLDGFKLVNDNLGHDQGDNCIARVIDIMLTAISGKGKLYRFGGDEFVVILPNFDKSEGAATAERVRGAIDSGELGVSLKVTASIGIADSSRPPGVDAKALIKLADNAMYVAKKSKNSVFVGDGSNLGIQSGNPESLCDTKYDVTDDLYVGERVFVAEHLPGQSPNDRTFGSAVWVIREIDREKGTAVATPVMSWYPDRTPKIEGQMRGPASPFRKANIAS
jgi:diguanylate cyclase (GGDEF)-like protein